MCIMVFDLTSFFLSIISIFQAISMDISIEISWYHAVTVCKRAGLPNTLPNSIWLLWGVSCSSDIHQSSPIFCRSVAASVASLLRGATLCFSALFNWNEMHTPPYIKTGSSLYFLSFWFLEGLFDSFFFIHKEKPFPKFFVFFSPDWNLQQEGWQGHLFGISTVQGRQHYTIVCCVSLNPDCRDV